MEYGSLTPVVKSQPQPQSPKKLGPERSFFKKLFGRSIRVFFVNEDEEDCVDGVLHWVDRYTILVAVSSGLEVPKERMIYKHAIQSIQPLSEGTNARGRQAGKGSV